MHMEWGITAITVIAIPKAVINLPLTHIKKGPENRMVFGVF